MSTEIRVPQLGESVTEAIIAGWLKKPGEAVTADEPIIELETDKVTLEVPAPADGVMGAQQLAEGDTVEVGALLGTIEGAGATPAATPTPATPTPATPTPATPTPATPAAAAPAPAPVVAPGADAPSVRKIAAENNLDTSAIAGTGPKGNVTKADALAAAKAMTAAPAPSVTAAPAGPARDAGPRENKVRMTKLRQTIARRLKEAQNTAAMLTTFNEVDMSAILALRNEHKDYFGKKHGVKLGFMSFFVKAAIAALQEIPAVNAEISGDSIIYKNFYDIGVAVGTEQGLVVPVIRDADQLGFAGIEKTIADFGARARDGKLSMADMQGGTFTISNGGVYGSLLSTPILNTPQSAILGMHKTQERPVAIGGKVEVRSMMYLAVSYDHRIVDGKEAVSFLVRIKEGLEDPRRLLLDL